MPKMTVSAPAWPWAKKRYDCEAGLSLGLGTRGSLCLVRGWKFEVVMVQVAVLLDDKLYDAATWVTITLKRSVP